ncbi:MAG: PAS domain S-box protein [Gemmatimonadota bacterium]
MTEPHAILPPPDGGFLLAPRPGDATASLDFEVIAAHGCAMRLLQRPEHEIVGRTLRELFPIPRIEEFILGFHRVLTTGEPMELEYPILFGALDATWIWQRSVREGTQVRVLLRDLTAQRVLEVRQAAADQQFDLLFRHSPLPILLHDPGGRITDANDALVTLLGSSREAVESRRLQELIDTPVDDADLGTPVRRMLRCDNGSEQPVVLHIDPLPHGYRLVAVRDISADEQLQRADRALRESEGRFRATFEESVVGKALLGLTGETLRVNAALATMLGYDLDAAQRLQWRDILHPDEHAEAGAKLGRIVSGDLSSSFAERRAVHADGSPVWVRVTVSAVTGGSGQLSFMLAHIEDITAAKRLSAALQESEEQVRQAQKMEAIGKLAGGVAHDFNNLLATISATTELLLQDLPDKDPHRSDVLDIALAADRAKTLTRQLLSFSRQEVERLTVVEVDRVVQRIRPLLQRLLAPGQRLVVECAASDCHVACDAGQLELALFNLVANARDAMSSSGTVSLHSGMVTVVAGMMPSLPKLVPGDYLTIRVTDDGSGMSEEVRQRLFEPFFTTKPHGQGTGLGLAIIFGFLERANGGVTVESVPGKGSSFTLYLPCTVAPTEPPPVQAAAPALHSGGEGRHILLVDDEPTLRRTARRLLERKGYRVTEAGNAHEAMAIIATAPTGSIHSIVTDQAMPGRTGRELLQEIETHHPDIRRILMSGYTGDAVVREGLRGDDTRFLAKPFTIDELIAALEG